MSWVQVRFVVGEGFYHASTEETEEQLQEGECACQKMHA